MPCSEGNNGKAINKIRWWCVYVAYYSISVYSEPQLAYTIQSVLFCRHVSPDKIFIEPLDSDKTELLLIDRISQEISLKRKWRLSSSYSYLLYVFFLLAYWIRLPPQLSVVYVGKWYYTYTIISHMFLKKMF